MMVGKKGRWTTKAEKAARKERTKSAELFKEEEGDENSSTELSQQLIVDNKLFEEYYVEQGIITKDEAEKFMERMKQGLPISFRISVDKSSVQDVVRVLKRDYFASFSSLGTEEGVLRSPSCISWLPNESAWQLELDYSAENELFSDFLKFLYQETECGNVVQQDVVGMLSAHLLDVKPNHKVLDLRASPGHRTTHLIDLLHSDERIPNPDGVVIANETHLKRCFFLKDQIRRFFSPNFAIVNMDANNLPSLYLSPDSESEPFLYDRIVCGFPSSGDGMFRNNLDGLRCWTPNVPLSHHGHLIQMLYSGLSSLAIGGRLVFSTYSMNPIETEAVVYAVIMQQRGTVELEDVSKQMPDLVYEKGLHSWKVMAKGPRWFHNFEEVPEHFQTQISRSTFPPTKEEAERVGLDKCIRILPHKQDTAGIFIAVFKRISSLYEAWQREQEEQQKAYDASIEEAKVKEEEAQKLKEQEKKELEKEKEEKTISENETTPMDAEKEQKSGDVATDEQQTSEQNVTTKETDAGDDKMTEWDPEKEPKDETETRDGSAVSNATGNEKETKEETGKSAAVPVDEKTDSEKQTTKEEIEKVSQDEIKDFTNGDHSSYYDYWNQSSCREEDGTGKTDADEKKPGVEGTFVFLKPEDTIWLELKEFYGISDSFPVTCLTYCAVDGMKQHIYFVTETIKKLIEVNQKVYSFVSVGVKVLTHTRQGEIKCPYRLTQEGLSAMLPFMTKRIIRLTEAEFMAVVTSSWVTLDGLTEKTRKEVISLENGSFAFVLEPEKKRNSLKCHLSVSAWKDDENTYRTFVPTYMRLHFLRIVGADMKRYEEKSDADQFESAMAIIARNFPV